MNYVDPHHKRTQFFADAVTQHFEGERRRLVFTGHGQHSSVALIESGLKIVGVVEDANVEFVLRKAQILERSRWLTRDFEDNPILRRIVVHIDTLDRVALRDQLRSLILSRDVLFYSHGV